MAHAGGRPLKFQSVEELEALVNDYFETEDGKELPTITGLAVHLDTDRKTLYNYGEKEEFFPTIKRALSRCEVAVEQSALRGKANATMAIFTLKNNYGWVDKTEQDITTAGDKIETKSVDTDVLTQFMMTMKDQTKQ